jgi:type I restriction enzyme, S subunit
MIIEKINQYDTYLDSDVEWIGKIPNHWSIRRVKELGNLVLGKMLDNKADSNKTLKKYLKSKNISWLKVNVKSVEEMFFSDYEMSLYRVKKNDLLFSEGGEVGKTSYWDNELDECYIQNSVHKFSTNSQNISRYFLYLSYAAGHANYYDSIVNFVSIKHLTKEKLSRVLWLSPPKKEQQNISEYLDVKTSQIDKKINLLTKKSDLYEKLKQSLINKIITQGLDKTVAMKDSGVDWIGEIPKNWNVLRLKELTEIQNSNVDKKSHEDEIPIQLCNYVDVYKNDFIDGSLGFMNATAKKSEINQFKIKKDDVFITKDSETCDDIAMSALSKESFDNVLCGYHLTRLRTKNKVLLGVYLFRLFQSKSYRFRFVISAKGITRVGLGQSAIADSLTPAPPICEQQEISDYLDKKTSKIDEIITAINTQIKKLKELRKTLINDVVTGKIKVA